MRVPSGMNQPESRTERLPEARGVVTRDGQPAAFFRAVQRESGDDGVTAGFQTVRKARDIGGAVFLVGEKVERRPVVPDVVWLHRLPDRDIRHQPVNPVGARSEASLGAFNAAPDRSSTLMSSNPCSIR